MKKIFLITALLLTSTLGWSAIKTQTIEYKEGKNVLKGTLVYDDAISAIKPGVLVVHEWKGLDDYARKRAEQVAALGYVALAVDIYGNGFHTDDTKEAARLSGLYKNDRALLRKRIEAGLAALKKDVHVDASKIAAIGYCFGGTTVLELARSGADVKGVVSFHGGLNSLKPEEAKNIKGKVLVLHGADDPYSPKEEVLAFEDEMRNANVDWQLNLYSNAVHGFTNPANGPDNSKGAAYNEKADLRSWEAMKLFFNEIFK